jgi:hypothetical protein
MSDRCLFFGCWNKPGHYLVGPGGARTGLPNELAYGLSRKLDGAFAPKRTRSGRIVSGHIDYDAPSYWEMRDAAECPQGQFLRHQLLGYTLIQWWDRCQGDKRGACNSTVLLEGEHTTAEMLGALAMHFPHVLENLRKSGVELVEVIPDV